MGEDDEAGGGFTHLGDATLVEGARLRVVRGSFSAPDGSRFSRDIVRNQAVVAVVPLLEDGSAALLVRQYRGPIDATMLEIPAGLCDVVGEPPEATARRELIEEAGLEAGTLEAIATMHPSAGFSDQVTTIYVATGNREVPTDRQGTEEQHMTTEVVPLDRVETMISSGKLTDAKTIVGLLMARDGRRATDTTT